jgi:hypothetical protein
MEEEDGIKEEEEEGQAGGQVPCHRDPQEVVIPTICSHLLGSMRHRPIRRHHQHMASITKVCPCRSRDTLDDFLFYVLH